MLPLALWLSFWLRLAHPFCDSFIHGLSMLQAALMLGLPFCLHGAIHRSHPLCRQPGALLPPWAQWVAGANACPHLLDAVPAVVAAQQLVAPLAFAHRLYRAIRFALRDVLLSLQNTSRHALTRDTISSAEGAGV
jgi:hypothetical protein